MRDKMKSIYGISIVVLLFVSNNFSQQWVQVGNGLNGTVRALTRGGYVAEIYAGGNFSASGNIPLDRVARLSGSSWTEMDTIDRFNNIVHCLYSTDYDLYAGGHFTGYIQKYHGAVWSYLSSTFLTDDVNSITSIGSNIYACGSFSHAGNTRLNYVGRWDGSSWSPLDTGLNSTASALAVIGNNLYVGGSFYKTYAGMDLKRIGMWNGHWNQLGTGIPNGWVNCLAVSGNNLYVGGSFAFSTSNGVAHNIARWDGTSWYIVGTQLQPGFNNEVLCLAVDGSTVYAGGLFTAINGDTTTMMHVAKWNGTSWSQMGQGLNTAVYSLCISGGGYLYAGGDFTYSGTTPIQHVAKWSIPIGIQQINNEIPVKHALGQNYPNPFNPSTKFRFSLAETEDVTITVYDITGKTVEKLVNEKLNAGSYEVEWNAVKLSSGTYFYKLKAGNYTETRKMVLVK
jgi:hypothetical protein